MGVEPSTFPIAIIGSVDSWKKSHEFEGEKCTSSNAIDIYLFKIK